MAGAIIYTPDTGTDWATAWEQAEYARKSKMGMALTNYNNTSLPAVATGSWAEVAGSIYKWTSEEAISGSPTASYINFVKLVPSGSGDTAIVTATWTNTAPTWSDAYQGWYSGTSRYVAGCQYDGTYYTNKFLLDTGTDVYRDFLYDIGDWDMDANEYAYIDTVLGTQAVIKKIRTINAVIRNDADDTYYNLPYSSTATGYVQGQIYPLSIPTGYITLHRLTGGTFDHANFNSTSYNRGWVTIRLSVI